MFQSILVMLNLIKYHIAETVIGQGQLHNGETDTSELQRDTLILVLSIWCVCVCVWTV